MSGLIWWPAFKQARSFYFIESMLSADTTKCLCVLHTWGNPDHRKTIGEKKCWNWPSKMSSGRWGGITTLLWKFLMGKNVPKNLSSLRSCHHNHLTSFFSANEQKIHQFSSLANLPISFSWWMSNLIIDHALESIFISIYYIENFLRKALLRGAEI